MGNDSFFIIGFVVLIIFLGLAGAGGGFFNNEHATSTAPSALSEREATFESAPNETSFGETEIHTSGYSPSNTEKLSPNEIESRVASLYHELDSLTEKLREAKLREPISPYVGRVDLRMGNARAEDPDEEYLEIRASFDATQHTNISNWYLESYVTDERVALPQGDRVVERRRKPVQSDIVLDPDESAYVMTGESPIHTSFRENMCTGYLSRIESFYPSLSWSCPSPETEMRRFADIALDDDSCFDFVERIGICLTPSDESIDDADLSGACRRFVEQTLNYEDCVEKHQTDPFFDNPGTWHIYLEQDEELWRPKREIIRLMDENDQVVDVIEY